MRYLLILFLFLSTIGCRTKKKESAGKTISSITDTSALEKHRPDYHFTPAKAWMNDPNGLVFYKGQYHLFYQYYPDSTVWGPMHWGHATSNDLIHWERLPIALYPDSLGYIFSGSAVVDWNNTSGLGTIENPPLVAIFTYHDPVGAKQEQIDFQYQGLAYSLDSGETWQKYENNPVLPNPGIIDFRDPKVFWSDGHEKWIMSLAVKDRINFYSSPNLKDWILESEFGQSIGAHGGVWECPDLSPLTDQDGNVKWILLVSINPGGPQGGSATQYFVGDFDGKTFTPDDTKGRWLDYGADNYAGVTYSDIPQEDGRRLFIGWMSNWDYAQVVPTKSWRSAMTLPRELKLGSNQDGYYVKSSPATETALLTGNEIQNDGDSFTTGDGSFMVEINESLDDNFALKLSNDFEEEFIIMINSDTISMDRTKAGNSDFNSTFAAIHKASMPNLPVSSLTIYFDNSSVELFVNKGELVMTDLLFPTEPFTKVQLSQKLNSLKVYDLNGIWTKENTNAQHE